MASRLEETAGRQAKSIDHEFGRNKFHGTTPEPIFEGQRMGSNGLITLVTPPNPSHLRRVNRPPNTVKKPALRVRENQFLENPLPSRDLRSSGHGARPKQTAPFESRVGQSRQAGTVFKRIASVPTRDTNAVLTSVEEQIATLNNGVAALTVQGNTKGDKIDAQNSVSSQDMVPFEVPGMSMKLPFDVPLFSGTGDQEFRTWIKLFERATRACKVTTPADLLSSLDAFLTGPASCVFQNVQASGIKTYEGMKIQLAEQFKSSALVRNASMSFMNRTQRVGEKIVEFATDLWDLADEAYSEVGSDRLDFLLRDRFISGVLPDFIVACEFDRCTSFQSAFDCARRVEERILSAQVAQKLRGKNPTPIRPMSEIPRNFSSANFSLGSGSEIDTFRQEWKDSQKELLDSVCATIEESRNLENTGQREGGDSPSSNIDSRYNFRWCDDGTPVCSYCQ
ncbi:MAG: hypothetical protein GY696_12625, partial [Gammaproteobacteria bacterium]|nr:hypothetical protein [Gammaproteobacteria bacterium]